MIFVMFKIKICDVKIIFQILRYKNIV